MTDNKDLTEQYEEDLRIIEAATEGPWKSSVFDIYKITGAITVLELGHTYRESNANYIAHFNPSYTKQLVEKANEATALAEERDALAKRVEELEKGLKKIAAIEDNLTGGDWDEIEEARSIAEELLK